MAAVVTDGLKGLGINGRGILSLFSDIFPIATRLGLRLLTVHRTGERMMGGREAAGKRYAAVQLLKKLNASGHLPVHRFC